MKQSSYWFLHLEMPKMGKKSPTNLNGWAHILVKGIITITRGPTTANVATKQLDIQNNGVIKSFATFIDCITGINNTQVDNQIM